MSAVAQTKPATTKVVTGIVRGSFLNLFEARAAQPGQDPKYSMVILIPKADKKTLEAIASAQEAAADKKWGSKRPPKVNLTLHDGDGVKPESGEPYGPECKGHMVISASTKQAPGVVDAQLNPILDKMQCVSGDYFRVSLNFFGYEMSGKKGVSAGLQNVQLIRKGDPLGNVSRAEDDFTAANDEDDFLN